MTLEELEVRVRKLEAENRQIKAMVSNMANGGGAPVINVNNPPPERCAWDFETDADGVTHATPKKIK